MTNYSSKTKSYNRGRFWVICTSVFFILGCSHKVYLAENSTKGALGTASREKIEKAKPQKETITRPVKAVDVEKNIQRFSRLIDRKKNKPNNSQDLVLGLLAFILKFLDRFQLTPPNLQLKLIFLINQNQLILMPHPK